MHQITISDLPEELIDAVLRYIKDSAATSDFWNCLRTCRRWHRIGLGVHGRLDFAVSATIESSTRRHQLQREYMHTESVLLTNFSLDPPSELFLCELRSLTVHVNHARIEGSFKAGSGRNLFMSLAESFRSTRKLSTFSLKFADEGWDFPSLDVPAVLQSDIAALVAALPTTISNLELDTVGTDVPPSTEIQAGCETRHLCVQIGKIFGQLRYLRLRVGHVCEALFGPGSAETCPPSDESSDQDITDTRTFSQLARSWKMQGLTIWLPWGEQEEESSLARTLRVLTKLSTTPHPIITIISQRDRRNPDRKSILDPDPNVYSNFVCLSKSNQRSPAEGNFERHLSGFCDHSHRAGLAVGPMSCLEHIALLTSQRRYFTLGIESCPQSPYSHIAEWWLEDYRQWAQDGHRGCRYPSVEATSKPKPFWKAAHTKSYAGPEEPSSDQSNGTGLFHCLFPGCRTRCITLTHLRGHHMYAHPERPHDGSYYGAQPCPALGCSHVGHSGFHNKQELEEHLLTHHLGPCAMNSSQ